MFKLLTGIFVKNRENTGDPKVRKSYATLASIYGICLNIILFIAKFIAGTISGSMAITADAFNNLSDAGSSVITFFGFMLSGKRPDRKHPYGYGRIEYITGFIISALILLVGVELGISSVNKIITPEPIEVSIVPVIIMIASILVKFYMFTYNRSTGKKINSQALSATATDSLTDSIATAVTLISMGLVYFFHINVDGWAGLLVSLFIIYAGITSAIDTISPLLGQPPEEELVKEIEATSMKYEAVKGIHDLMIHDYGPGRLIISLHCEVDGENDMYRIHDEIDNLETELNEKFNCVATIHMDPIESNNSVVGEMREKVADKVKELYADATVHDFRMVPGPTHTNLIFDAVLPMSEKDKDSDAKEKIEELIKNDWDGYFAVVHIDRSYL